MREHCFRLTARACVYRSHMSGDILECHKLQGQAKASGPRADRTRTLPWRTLPGAFSGGFSLVAPSLGLPRWIPSQESLTLTQATSDNLSQQLCIPNNHVKRGLAMLIYNPSPGKGAGGSRA